MSFMNRIKDVNEMSEARQAWQDKFLELSKKKPARIDAKKEEIALWAIKSYKGDAGFMVDSPTIGNSSIAGAFWEGLRAHFIRQPFVRAIQSEISDLKDDVVVSIKSQKQGQDLYNKHAEQFLRDMYKAHRNGKQRFGENYKALTAWVKKHFKMDEDTGEAAGFGSRITEAKGLGKGGKKADGSLTRAERKKKNKAAWKKMKPETKKKYTGDVPMPSAPASAKKREAKQGNKAEGFMGRVTSIQEGRLPSHFKVIRLNPGILLVLDSKNGEAYTQSKSFLSGHEADDIENMLAKKGYRLAGDWTGQDVSSYVEDVNFDEDAFLSEGYVKLGADRDRFSTKLLDDYVLHSAPGKREGVMGVAHSFFDRVEMSANVREYKGDAGFHALGSRPSKKEIKVAHEQVLKALRKGNRPYNTYRNHDWGSIKESVDESTFEARIYSNAAKNLKF